MAIILETGRLILRTWLLNDLKDFFEIYGDPEVWRYVDASGVYKNEDAARRSLRAGIAYEQEHGFCHWAVVEKSRGRVVGACGFNLYEGGPQLELVYHFARLYWGRGFATEAAGACMRYAFDKLGAPAVVASIDAKNQASRRVLEKIGFVHQGSKRINNSDEDFYVALAPERNDDEG
ncbi:MAG TPA: GNAT family N-acetyltransferase [Pyrinomonadaceae bacterium]|jgi:RimJ/RimL family protein N-acetyltransferase